MLQTRQEAGWGCLGGGAEAFLDSTDPEDFPVAPAAAGDWLAWLGFDPRDEDGRNIDVQSCDLRTHRAASFYPDVRGHEQPRVVSVNTHGAVAWARSDLFDHNVLEVRDRDGSRTLVVSRGAKAHSLRLTSTSVSWTDALGRHQRPVNGPAAPDPGIPLGFCANFSARERAVPFVPAARRPA